MEVVVQKEEKSLRDKFTRCEGADMVGNQTQTVNVHVVLFLLRWVSACTDMFTTVRSYILGALVDIHITWTQKL